MLHGLSHDGYIHHGGILAWSNSRIMQSSLYDGDSHRSPASEFNSLDYMNSKAARDANCGGRDD